MVSLDGFTADGSTTRPSTAGDVTGGSGVSFASGSRPSTVDGTMSRSGLRSRESLRSRGAHSSGQSSVFTVLDDSQSALDNFAAGIGWQLSVNEKPRDRYPLREHICHPRAFTLPLFWVHLKQVCSPE